MAVATNLLLVCAVSIRLPYTAGVEFLQRNPAADPFADVPTTAEVPSPDGPEWSAPPPPPPPPPVPREAVAAKAQAQAQAAEDPEEPFSQPLAPEESGVTSAKPLMTGGVVLLAIGAVSAGLTYYTYDNRRKAENELSAAQQMNQVLVAAGLMPQSTSDEEKKIRVNRGLSAGFGAAAAVLLITGGVMLLVGRSRASKPGRAITWAPRAGGIEVAF